jgi:glycosyltransferase involved in cell wall biosynthesis
VPGHVTYLVRSWPRLSQTFVVEEVLALERLGVRLRIVSLTRSGERVVQPQVAKVRADVQFLDGPRPVAARLRDHARLAGTAPARYLATAAFAVRHRGYADGYATASALACWDHAVRLAAQERRTRRRPDHLHAHFAHDPALVGLLLHRLTGVGFTFTAHARDLYQTPADGLVAKAEAARAVVTCCEANAAYLDRVLPARLRARTQVLRHGLDVSRFVPAPRDDSAAPELAAVPDDPAVPAERPARLVSVGRLVAKKGFDDLLRACALLAAQGRNVCLRVVGDGPLRDDLLALARELGIADRLELAGECDSDGVLRALHAADVFALTPCVPDDGDRDGIPNVLVEAMACGLPVVATRAGGVAEVVRSGENGLLAEPRDPAAVAACLARLLDDPGLGARLGAAARRTVEDELDSTAAAQRLTELFAGTPR